MAQLMGEKKNTFLRNYDTEIRISSLIFKHWLFELFKYRQTHVLSFYLQFRITFLLRAVGCIRKVSLAKILKPNGK